MATVTTHRDDNQSALRALINRLAAVDRWLLYAGFVSAAMILFTAVLALIDPRTITGAPAWVKPMKFAISIAIYSFTLLWMLSLVEGRRGLVKAVSIATAVGFMVELAIISLQAARGEISHYNMSTPLNAVLYYTMAGFIGVVWVANLGAAVLLLVQKFDNKVFAWGIRLGLLVTLVGAGLGFVMTARPSDSQAAAMAQGEGVDFFGAHSVGVEDGGEGLPFVGWSTEGGDIRVAHFVGLHALQIVPLLGWVIASRPAGWLPNRSRLAMVFSFGLGYLAITLILLWQAMRGQPLIAPDALTLSAFSSAIAAVAMAWAVAVITGRRTEQRTQRA